MSTFLKITTNANLAPLSTFRLPARAARLIVLERLDDLRHVPDGPMPFVLGGGSNTLFLTNYPGTILLNKLNGITTGSLDEHRVRVTVAAGENWHRLVRRCLNDGLYGLENLAMIPGSVGAAPMQNIGAYGAELSQVLEAVDVWDWRAREHRRLSAAECRLGYRSSRFRNRDRGRFLITGVHLVLDKRPRAQTAYATLKSELDRRGLEYPDPRQVAAAVMRVRRHRLPDPARIANAGSFFKNPVVSAEQAETLISAFPDLPNWPVSSTGLGELANPGKYPDTIKLSAAWMIDHLGWKGKSLENTGVYANHALVLVNHGGATGGEVLALARSIRAGVHDTFGVSLEPEPLLLAETRPEWAAEIRNWSVTQP